MSQSRVCIYLVSSQRRRHSLSADGRKDQRERARWSQEVRCMCGEVRVIGEGWGEGRGWGCMAGEGKRA